MKGLFSYERRLVVFGTGPGRQAVVCEEVALVRADPMVGNLASITLKSGEKVFVEGSFDEVMRALGLAPSALLPDGSPWKGSQVVTTGDTK